ncbi:carboxypeptidase regulatory-like domain-containing protein [bacterium]|nr:carboxypeptidase regulatory-like domain-containing protein [bacterium]
MEKLLICLFSILAILSLSGCRMGGNFDNGSNPSSSETPIGVISGLITASATLETSIGADALRNGKPGSLFRQDTILADLNVENVDVWLEEYPDIKTRTNSAGQFTLSNVPFGEHRVVANIAVNKASLTEKRVYKIRSSEITLSKQEPKKRFEPLSLESATNRVSGILIDPNGNPVENAELWLWGERFYTDDHGRYVSPPLPESSPIDEIKVKKASGFKQTSIITAFTSGTKPVIISTLSLSDTTTDSPKVMLFRSKIGKLDGGETLGIWAIFYGAENDDSEKLKIIWSKENGTLSSGSEALPNELKKKLPQSVPTDAKISHVNYTSPKENGNYTITAKVVDTGGRSESQSIHISVGQEPISESNRPPTGYIVTTSSVLAGHSIGVSIVASDPNKDALGYGWSASPNPGEFKCSKSASTTWTAPDSPGTFTITCTIMDFETAVEAKAKVHVVSAASTAISIDAGKIAGYVIDNFTDKPVEGALVSILGADIFTATNSDGYFEFTGLKSGEYDLEIQRDGYAPQYLYGIVVHN